MCQFCLFVVQIRACQSVVTVQYAFVVWKEILFKNFFVYYTIYITVLCLMSLLCFFFLVQVLMYQHDSSQLQSRIQADANSDYKRRENNPLVAPGSFDWQISSDKSLCWFLSEDRQKTPFPTKPAGLIFSVLSLMVQKIY